MQQTASSFCWLQLSVFFSLQKRWFTIDFLLLTVLKLISRWGMRRKFKKAVQANFDSKRAVHGAICVRLHTSCARNSPFFEKHLFCLLNWNNKKHKVKKPSLRNGSLQILFERFTISPFQSLTKRDIGNRSTNLRKAARTCLNTNRDHCRFFWSFPVSFFSVSLVKKGTETAQKICKKQARTWTSIFFLILDALSKSQFPGNCGQLGFEQRVKNQHYRGSLLIFERFPSFHFKDQTKWKFVNRSKNLHPFYETLGFFGFHKRGSTRHSLGSPTKLCTEQPFFETHVQFMLFVKNCNCTDVRLHKNNDARWGTSVSQRGSLLLWKVTINTLFLKKKS